MERGEEQHLPSHCGSLKEGRKESCSGFSSSYERRTHKIDPCYVSILAAQYTCLDKLHLAILANFFYSFYRYFIDFRYR